MTTSEEYAHKISNKIHFVGAIRTTLWVCAILLSIIGMIIVALTAIAGVYTTELVIDATEEPLDNAQNIVLQVSQTLSKVIAQKDYLSASQNLNQALFDISQSTEQMADTLQTVSSNPIVQIGFSGFEDAVQKMRDASTKIQATTTDVENGQIAIEQAYIQLENVQVSLKTCAKSIENLKVALQTAKLLVQIIIVGFALAIELLLSSCLLIAFAYGVPKNDVREITNKNSENEQKNENKKTQKFTESVDKKSVPKIKQKQQENKQDTDDLQNKKNTPFLVMPKID